MEEFPLPPAVAALVDARNKLREYYREILQRQGSNIRLDFTPDGNLIGDLGEALAVELFGIRLVETKATEAIDGYAPNGSTTVQIKASVTGRGPSFRHTKKRADHLLFFHLDLENARGSVVYNGPEHNVVKWLPEEFEKPSSVPLKRVREENARVLPEERLPRVQ